LEGDDDTPVIVGGMVTGEKRVITIEGKKLLIEIHNNPRLRKGQRTGLFNKNKSKCYKLYKKSSDYSKAPIDIFKDLYELSKYLGYSREYVGRIVRKSNGLIGDFKIIRMGE
jgi:hypothetical protein